MRDGYVYSFLIGFWIFAAMMLNEHNILSSLGVALLTASFVLVGLELNKKKL